MVKTFLTGFPICMLLGLAFALFRTDIERDDPFYRFASFWWGLLGTAIYFATAYHAYSLWPDWMWMYFTAETITGRGWVYLFFLLYFLPFTIGYILGTHGRRNSWFVLINSFVIIVLVEYFTLSEFWYRYGFIKTDAGMVSIFEHEGFKQQFYVGAGVLISFLLVCWYWARRRYIRAIESGKIVRHLFHPGKRRTLQTIAEAILPEAPDLRKVSARDMPLADIFSRELADMNPFIRMTMRLFIEYLNSTPFIYRGIPFRFEFLKKEKQLELLDQMYKSKNITKKVPLTIIRMFLLQFYYQDQRVLDEIGYVGESWGMFRPHLRWMNVPEYRDRERSVVWSELSKTIRKTSK